MVYELEPVEQLKDNSFCVLCLCALLCIYSISSLLIIINFGVQFSCLVDLLVCLLELLYTFTLLFVWYNELYFVYEKIKSIKIHS